MAIYRAEGALGADAQEGRETVRESLTPAEAHRRNRIRDRVFCDGSDDLAVRKGLFYPTFVVWNVAEKPSVALEIIRLSSRLSINAKVARGYLDLVEGDPFVHILLKQPLKQLDNLCAFRARLVIKTIMFSALCRDAIQAHERLHVPILRANDTV